MRKLYKKMISICLVLAICIMSTGVVEAESNLSINDGGNYSVEYSMMGNSVIEKTTWSNLPGTIIVREVKPNGTGELVIMENEQRSITSFSGANYSQYVKWVENAPTLSENSDIHNETSTLGSDIVGSQYRHVYISQSGPITYTRPNLTAVQTLADAYSLLAGNMVNIPSLVISAYAQVVLHQVAKSPDRIVITTKMYEVLFSDGVYYTHCYHMKCNSYNPNASYTDYSQSVGG